MKYAFIVNPASGRGRHSKGIIPELEQLISSRPDEDIKIYYTEGERDATVIADALASEAGCEIAIFACGGDGTVQEVANGVFGHDNAILGVVPVGSGNDFVRELSKARGNTADYMDPAKQLEGSPQSIDLIRMSWIEGGKEASRMIVNGVNIGFDGNTAALAHDLKMLPGVSGTGSYILAVLSNLIAKRGQMLRIIADGEEFHTGRLLLSTAANGGFCGGGVNSCPYADLRDGLMELLAVKDLSRRRFAMLFPSYKKGRLFEIKGIEKLASYRQARTVTIEPMEAPSMRFVGDGEIFETGAIELEVIHDAVRVMVL